jgi:hypothetical protein
MKISINSNMIKGIANQFKQERLIKIITKVWNRSFTIVYFKIYKINTIDPKIHQNIISQQKEDQRINHHPNQTTKQKNHQLIYRQFNLNANLKIL